ncbi:MAG TPA: hypothetical protein VNO30_48975 [Kofleriaceae bacterium]|nr:hypothetical protein [Kofleriaceae bacterium]
MSVHLPGSVTRLVWRGDALLMVRHSTPCAASTGEIHQRRILECLDESGGRRWQHALEPRGLGELYAPEQLAIDPAGIAWVLYADGLTGIAADGRLHARHLILREEDEQCGGFALLANGFLVSVFGIGRLASRVLRLDASGAICWSTVLPVTDVSHRGVVQMTAASGWRATAMPPWQPHTWIPCNPPLVVSQDRVLARFFDMPRSGISRAYGLDLATGAHLFTSEPHPPAEAISLGQGRFLVGVQGYGAFESWLVERDGDLSRTWPGQGRYLPDAGGQVHVVEMENRLPSKMHFTTLRMDGTVERGPWLDGYYTSSAARLDDGSIVFWRNGALQEVTPEGWLLRLLKTDAASDHRVWPGDLATDGERVWFVINRENVSQLYRFG